MVEDRAELGMYRLEVHRRIGLPVLVPAVQHLVLPGQDVLRLNLRNLALAEVRQQLRADDVFLGVPGVLLDAALHVGGIDLHKAGKGHIEIALRLVHLLALPGQRLSLGGKPALCRLLPFTLPIGVQLVVNPDSDSVRILASCILSCTH